MAPFYLDPVLSGDRFKSSCNSDVEGLGRVQDCAGGLCCGVLNLDPTLPQQVRVHKLKGLTLFAALMLLLLLLGFVFSVLASFVGGALLCSTLGMPVEGKKVFWYCQAGLQTRKRLSSQRPSEQGQLEVLLQMGLPRSSDRVNPCSEAVGAGGTMAGQGRAIYLPPPAGQVD